MSAHVVVRPIAVTAPLGWNAAAPLILMLSLSLWALIGLGLC